MSMRADHASIAQRPLWRRQQFWRITLPITAVVAAALAGFLVYDAFVGQGGVTESKTGWGVTYKDPPKPKTVPLDPQVKTVARQFIQTAVARKNLDAAYAISGPGIREGMTLKQWRNGEIAVVPYLVNDSTTARMAIDQSYKTSALIEVFMSTPHQRGRIFFAHMIKTKSGKWLVDSWVPRGSPGIPNIQ
jgi:hypothetical protein